MLENSWNTRSHAAMDGTNENNASIIVAFLDEVQASPEERKIDHRFVNVGDCFSK